MFEKIKSYFKSQDNHLKREESPRSNDKPSLSDYIRHGIKKLSSFKEKLIKALPNIALIGSAFQSIYFFRKEMRGGEVNTSIDVAIKVAPVVVAVAPVLVSFLGAPLGLSALAEGLGLFRNSILLQGNISKAINDEKKGVGEKIFESAIACIPILYNIPRLDAAIKKWRNPKGAA